MDRGSLGWFRGLQFLDGSENASPGGHAVEVALIEESIGAQRGLEGSVLDLPPRLVPSARLVS